MNIDIYVQGEIRREGRWEPVELVPPFDWHAATCAEQEEHMQHPAHVQSSRFLCHALAAISIIPSGLSFAPLRGLPDDADASNRLYFSAFNASDLSFVYLSELLTYDWQPSIELWLPPSLCSGSEPFTNITLPYLQTLVKNPDNLRMIFALN